MTGRSRRWPGDLVRAVGFAARSLARAPAFSLVIIGSLGVGLALATGTFAVANAYLFRSLPYPDAQRLYHVLYAPPGPYEPRGMTALDWNAVRDVVAAAIISGSAAYYVGEPGSLQFVQGLRVSPGFMAGLGVRPSHGQPFSVEDFRPGGPEVALIGYDLWRSRFHSDPDIVGRVLPATPEDPGAGTVSLRIVGVLPPGFWFGRTSESRPELLVPMRTPARAYMVRLRPGVPVALAEQRITAAARAVGSDFRPDWTGVHLESVHERYVAELRPLLVGVSAGALLVLALACTNVVMLVLLRALRRRQELAVRFALGAGNRHVLRLLVAEAGLLCAGAVALAMVLTVVGLRTLVPAIEALAGKPPPGGPSMIQLDANMAVLVGSVVVMIAVVIVLIPFVASRGQRLLKDTRLGAPTPTDGRTIQRLRSALLTIEVAGALVLLTGGGLMIQSMVNLARTDLGFDAGHVSRTRLVLPSAYQEPAALARFYEQLGQRLAAANPSSTVSSSFPPFYPTNQRPMESDAGARQSAGVLPVGPGYFAVHGIALRRGREFRSSDRLESEPVAIVSESLAAQLWPGGAALGRQVRTEAAEQEEASASEPMAAWRRVVGVVRDVRQTYDDDDPGDLYLPFLQAPTRYANVQTRTDREPLPPSRLAELVREIDPFVRVEEPRLLSTEDVQFARVRFTTILLSVFAGFATGVALLGSFGVAAYSVQQREREIAIRIAVGSTRRGVLRLFLREGALAVGLGLAVGWWVTGASGRLIESQIYGVQAYAAGTLAAASVLLAAGALLALWLAVSRVTGRADILNTLKE